MDAYALTLDQANWVSERARQQAGKGQDQREDLFRPIEPKLILVRNDSGETIPAFGVVALSGAVVDTGVVFTTAIKPASTVYPVAVNGPSPIAAGLTGYVFVGPVVEVLYDGTTAITAGQGWGVNGFEIASFPTGKPIAWFSMLAVARSSLNTAYAIIEPMRQLIIKAPSGGIAGRRGSLLGSASCTVQVLSTTTAMMSQSTVSITVYNWSSSAVCTKGDRHGVAANIHGRWVIVAEDCTDKGSVLPPKGGGSVLKPAGDPISFGIQSITSFGTFHEVRYSGAGAGGGFGGA